MAKFEALILQDKSVMSYIHEIISKILRKKFSRIILPTFLIAFFNLKAKVLEYKENSKLEYLENCMSGQAQIWELGLISLSPFSRPTFISNGELVKFCL